MEIPTQLQFLGAGFASLAVWLVLSRIFTPVLSRVLHVYLHWRYPIRDTTGRRSIPSTPFQFPDGNGDVDKFINGPRKNIEWNQKYGGIYRIWNGMEPEVVVSTSSAIQTIFKDSDQHSKAKNMGSGYLMSQILGECVGLLNGVTWRSVRKKVDPPFMHSGASTLVPKMINMTEDHLEAFFSSRPQNDEQIDPVADLLMLPFLMIATVFYGDLTDGQVQWLNEWTPKREKLFAYALGGGLPRFALSRLLPTEANRSLNQWKKVWLQFNIDAYDIAKTRNGDVLFVRMWDDAENDGGMTRDQVLQTIDESLYANLDVGIGSVSWNLVFLACYPEIQQQLFHEIQEETASQGWERYVQRSDTFLEACICESLRLRPIAAFAVPQSAPTDRVADGYVIPAGTNVTVDIYSLNQRNPFWGSDPLTYRPARFMGLKPSQTRYNFSRFGFGPRQCMGKYMALPMVRIIVAKIIAGHQLSLKGGYEDVVKNSRGLGTHPTVKLRCVKRD